MKVPVGAFKRQNGLRQQMEGPCPNKFVDVYKAERDSSITDSYSSPSKDNAFIKKHGVALSNIEITEANIGEFKPCAKKYGVDFTLRKDKTTQPPHYVVIFKSKDADNLEQAFREFTAKTLSKEQRPSIRKVLSAVKQKVAAQTKQRAKEKIEERGLEL